MNDDATTAGPRHRAVAVAVNSRRVLIIRREHGGRRYAVLPGGGVEPGERVADAYLRELREETGLVGVITAELPTADTAATYFLVDATGQPVLGGPESVRADATNVYEPIWLDIGDLAAAGLVPTSANIAVQLALRDGVQSTG